MNNFFRKWGWYLLLGAGVAFAAFLLVGRKNAAKSKAAAASAPNGQPGTNTPGAPEYIPTTGDSYTNENINSNNSTITQNATAPGGTIDQDVYPPPARPYPQPGHPVGPTGPAQPVNPGIGPLPIRPGPGGRPIPPIGPPPPIRPPGPIGPYQPPPPGSPPRPGEPPGPIGPYSPPPGPIPVGAPPVPIGPYPRPGGPPMPPEGGIYNGGIAQGVNATPGVGTVPPAQPLPPQPGGPTGPAQPVVPDWKLQAIAAWEQHVSPPGQHYRWGGPPGSFPAGWGQYPNAPGAANEPRPGVYTWVTPLG